MALTNFLALTVFLLIVIFSHISPTNSKIFREYIGAEWNGVKFTDVPINSNVEFHFILSFAIDYTSSSATPTNGLFNIFWDDNLTPSDVVAIKQSNSNVKVALSIGGDQVDGQNAYFNPTSVSSWVSNAVTSLTTIIKEYNLDGIDIDYEHFKSDTSTFTQCIGQLITTLKNNGVISFASIAPFAEPEVQNNYKALWSQYGSIIDYVNYQFYAYDSDTTVSQFLGYFDDQTANFNGGKILASFATDRTSGGLGPQNGFFSACGSLKRQGKLYGIFVWSADDSLIEGFQYEKRAQLMLASA